MTRRLLPFIASILILCRDAAAHGLDDRLSPASWEWTPVIFLAIPLSLYASGVIRLWTSADIGAGISSDRFFSFALGWIFALLALASPIHTAGAFVFWIHMLQHEILMLVAAPLIVLGAPFRAFMWGLPKSPRHAAAAVLNHSVVRGVCSRLSEPFWAWALHAAAIWIWHAPTLFEAALESTVVHSLQHMAFFGTALLFWNSVFRSSRFSSRAGASILYLFTTALHSGALGALLTFSRRLLYPSYGNSIGFLGLTDIEDQQLGGLLMWIPGGILYTGAALFIVIDSLLRESAPRQTEAI